MSERVARRRERVARALKGDGVEALVVFSAVNVGYLTGFTGEASVLVLQRDRELLVTDGRFTEQVATECPGLEVHVRPVGQTVLAALSEVLNALGVTRVGFESVHLSVAGLGELRDGLSGSVELKPLAGTVEALRTVKDREEIAAIRAAIDVAERAFAMLRAGLRPEDSEKDAADALESYLRRCGATAASFPPIVAVGPNAARPHHRPGTAARIGHADSVLVDWGASGEPYKCDLTRILVTGKVTPKFEKVYRCVLAAQEAAIAAVRPGRKAEDIDAAARAVIAEAGYGRFFDHGLGHGVGREIHEAPWLRKGSETPLQPGMVVTIEPGIYLPGWGGIRIEDDVLVTPGGSELLTHVPRSLDSVRC